MPTDFSQGPWLPRGSAEIRIDRGQYRPRPYRMLAVALLVLGFVPLLFGANFLVDGGSALARRLGVPPIIIGLTIVAFGTSAPELVVNLFAAGTGTASLALGNVVGSNIFNVLVVLGCASLFAPLAVKHHTTWSEIPLAILAALAILVAASDPLIDGGAAVVSRSDGLLLLGFFAIFMAYTIHMSLAEQEQEEPAVTDMSLGRAVVFILLGLGMLVGGGKLIVDGAVDAARMLGFSERVIGLTVVAMGTSLPELATSVVAARKNNVDIAIGNVVGSNLFNSFFVLGLSATVQPLAVGAGATLDLLVNLVAGTALFVFLFTGRGRQLERWEGVLLLVGYAAYLAWLLATP